MDDEDKDVSRDPTGRMQRLARNLGGGETLERVCQLTDVCLRVCLCLRVSVYVCVCVFV